MECAKFAYVSPAITASNYTGAIRNILLMGVAASLDVPNVDYFEHLDGRLMVRIGRNFNLNLGLCRIIQYRQPKLWGNGYMSRLNTVDSISELQSKVNIR